MTQTGVLATPDQIEELREVVRVARKKPQPNEQEPESDSRERTKAISYRPSAAVEAALEEYRRRFPFKTDKTAIIERALRDFLRSQNVEIADEA